MGGKVEFLRHDASFRVIFWVLAVTVNELFFRIELSAKQNSLIVCFRRFEPPIYK
jgi:hypothetical protein